LAQTKMLSGKKIIVLAPDIFPGTVLFDIKIGSDGLVDDIVITDKEIEEKARRMYECDSYKNPPDPFKELDIELTNY